MLLHYVKEIHLRAFLIDDKLRNKHILFYNERGGNYLLLKVNRRIQNRLLKQILKFS
jgi:hypothetical protein